MLANSLRGVNRIVIPQIHKLRPESGPDVDPLDDQRAFQVLFGLGDGRRFGFTRWRHEVQQCAEQFLGIDRLGDGCVHARFASLFAVTIHRVGRHRQVGEFGQFSNFSVAVTPSVAGICVSSRTVA